jgi:carbamoyltransferase
MDESPYMMYAANVLKDDIPAVTHIDKTCRLQTVTKDQNLHFYNIIDCFYQKTNVPVLLNTSFNLAGDPLVQSFDDAIHTMKNSAIKYLYLPEVGKILRKD